MRKGADELPPTSAAGANSGHRRTRSSAPLQRVNAGRFQRNRLIRSRTGSGLAHAASTSQLDAHSTSWGPPALGSCTAHEEEVPASSLSSSTPSSSRGSTSSNSSSVLSDFDLVNDTIQEYLLASDPSDGEDSLGLLAADGTATAALYVSALLPVGSDVSRRRRMARKAPSSTALPTLLSRQLCPGAASRMRGSLSTGALATLNADAHAPLGRLVVKLRGSHTDGSGNRHHALLPPLEPVYRGVPVGPLSIVLDCDETLIYARDGPIHVRPFVKEFLDLCEGLRCEIIVWTAGVASYVNPILHAIADTCRRRAWFHHIISRHRSWYPEDCEREAAGVKDMRLLGRPLERMLMIENNPVSVARQPAHAILVEDYAAPNPRDDTLRSLGGVVQRAVWAMMGDSTSKDDERTAAVPMLRPVRSVADVLDEDGALTHAIFDLGDLDVLGGGPWLSSREEEEGSPRDSTGAQRRRRRRNPRGGVEAGAAGGGCYGPQLPSATGGRDGSGHNSEEEDEAGPLDVTTTGCRAGGTPATGPAMWSPALEPAHEPRTLHCRVLQASPTCPFLAARSFGWMNPIGQ